MDLVNDELLDNTTTHNVTVSLFFVLAALLFAPLGYPQPAVRATR